jgi:hypothetical protein
MISFLTMFSLWHVDLLIEQSFIDTNRISHRSSSTWSKSLERIEVRFTICIIRCDYCRKENEEEEEEETKGNVDDRRAKKKSKEIDRQRHLIVD